MKKYSYLLICMLFCLVSACLLYKGVVKSEPEQREIIDSGKYYRIYRESGTRVSYNVYNVDGEIVLSEEVDRPLRITEHNDNIVDIAIGVGSGITLHKYYSVAKNLFSQEFRYVLTNSDELVVYMDVPQEKPFKNRRVVVQNIFDKCLFYREFQLDFSYVDTPVVEAILSQDGASLQLTYLSGEVQKQISTSLNLGLGDA